MISQELDAGILDRFTAKRAKANIKLFTAFNSPKAALTMTKLECSPPAWEYVGVTRSQSTHTHTHTPPPRPPLLRQTPTKAASTALAVQCQAACENRMVQAQCYTTLYSKRPTRMCTTAYSWKNRAVCRHEPATRRCAPNGGNSNTGHYTWPPRRYCLAPQS